MKPAKPKPPKRGDHPSAWYQYLNDVGLGNDRVKPKRIICTRGKLLRKR